MLPVFFGPLKSFENLKEMFVKISKLEYESILDDLLIFMLQFRQKVRA